jgi:hypothetical protein
MAAGMRGDSYFARLGRIQVRLVAYRPSLEPLPEGHIRVVVQSVQDGEPIVEDPICTVECPTQEFEQGLAISRLEGWEITPWPVSA